MLSEERRQDLTTRWQTFTAKPHVRLATKIAQNLLLVGVVVYLIFKLTEVGWLEVIDALPSSPWFYILFLARYLALPLAEIPAYELVWRRPLWRYFAAFIRKRVYNYAVMGYSGEAFFTLWARRRLALSDKEILVGVKDNNLLSALASNIATVILIIWLAWTGGLQPGLEALHGSIVLFTLAFASAFSLSVLVIIFRDKIMDLEKGMMPKLVGIHGGRMVLVMVLHAAMYTVALPGGAFMAWVMLIALQLVLSRIPFLPNLDLIFLGAALSLSPIVGAPEAAIAGMLVAEAGLSQILNFGLFFATAHHARREGVLKDG